MLSLQLISCIIFISCIYQASLLPLNQIINNNNNYEGQQLKSYYFPSSAQRVNEVHDLLLTSTDDVDDSVRTIKSEMMESSASNYYSSSHDDNDEDYSMGAITASDRLHENFESEKIKPSDSSSKAIATNNNYNKTEAIVDDAKYKPNVTQQQVPNLDDSNNSNSNDNSNKFSKLLFSSPSATVSTSNGPSGRFKAIICHDCENSGGVNVGHSVSFSAIKSWNVGSSNVAQKSGFNDSLVKQNHQVSNSNNSSISSASVEQTSEKYSFDITAAAAAINGNKDADMQINQNVPIAENQGSVFKSDITVNEQQKQQPLNKDWNYSLLTVRNENIKVNVPSSVSSPSITSSTTVGMSNSSSLKKPIFNDLLKVPYDILNAPLTEKPPDTIKKTQIHINHQQKFNDTITNYQHFQQFVQKNPMPNHTGHYQSTPMPEQNYEVDESVSVMTNGRAHGIQSTTPKATDEHVAANGNEKNENHHKMHTTPLHVTHDDAKFGVVFEGRDFRKYKVEEKTDDGFIVGEYGYLSNTDGSPIFGVRYTADSNINPQLIYDALLKFLKL